MRTESISAFTLRRLPLYIRFLSTLKGEEKICNTNDQSNSIAYLLNRHQFKGFGNFISTKINHCEDIESINVYPSKTILCHKLSDKLHKGKRS